MEKTCVISALDDNLHTMKAYLLTASHKQGMSHDTKVTALADGAKNCWSVLSALTLRACLKSLRELCRMGI
jgi:hypothetical protein